MQKELIVVKGRVIEQNRSFAPNVGEHIGYEAGAKMIQRWHTENPDNVLASFTGREMIEKILAQPGCTGIRFFNGINDLGVKQLVLVGADINGNNILNYTITDNTGKLVKVEGIVGDKGTICPPSCGNGDGSGESWY